MEIRQCTTTKQGYYNRKSSRRFNVKMSKSKEKEISHSNKNQNTHSFMHIAGYPFNHNIINVFNENDRFCCVAERKMALALPRK